MSPENPMPTDGLPALGARGSSSSEVDKALLAIFQQRMDKCQTEQLWAVTTLGAAQAFVLSRSELFLTHLRREAILVCLGALCVGVLVFAIYRVHNYYEYRNDIAKLLKDQPDEPPYKYLKQDKGTFSAHGLIWVFGLAFVIFLPMAAQIYCLK